MQEQEGSDCEVKSEPGWAHRCDLRVDLQLPPRHFCQQVLIRDPAQWDLQCSAVILIELSRDHRVYLQSLRPLLHRILPHGGDGQRGAVERAPRGGGGTDS